jgi:hypothetical protein
MFCQAWQYMPVIPALRRLRQEDLEFKAMLGYVLRLCLKIKQKFGRTKLCMVLF